jgi:hypothetical protein
MLLKKREMAAISLRLLANVTGENPTPNVFGHVSSLSLQSMDTGPASWIWPGE